MRDYKFKTILCYNKEFIVERQAGQCIRDERLQVLDSIVP